MSAELTIRRASDARSRKKFLKLPFQLYRFDENWVPPLMRAQAKIFAQKTAFFENADMCLFLAERSGRCVGRIAAIHNKAHNAHCGDKTGFFGFFECDVIDGEAARLLFDAAQSWLAERGLQTIRGPVNPSMNAECGLLIDGFDSPPMALMPYNPPEYPGLFESAGLGKCKDLYAYLIEAHKLLPGTDAYERLERLGRVLRRRHPEVSLRPLDVRRWKDEIRRIMGIFEEARRDNWGYVPITENELLETASELKMVLDPEIVILAEVDGQGAGASLAIPNVNRGLSAAKGKLLPLGFLRFFRAMKKTREIRIFGIAALSRFRHQGIAALLLLETILRGMARGYVTGEASWVLEDNYMSNRTIRNALNPIHYKTYRIYEKPID